MTEHDLRIPAFACRFCGSPVSRAFADLGMTPLCETLISVADYDAPEAYFPLQAYVCDHCLLVQLRDCVSSSDVFTESYPYFSSYSSSWVLHAQRYVERMMADLQLGSESLVIEVASNDGYLLQHFLPYGVPVLGIEPSASVAQAALAKGIRTEMRFLTAGSAEELLRDYGPADLLIGNNVLAHVPDIRDFASSLAALLAPAGCLTLEFPHLLNLIRFNQFDTIYHEHFSYLSLHFTKRLLEHVGLTIVRVEKLTTHGGSLRVFAKRAGAGIVSDTSVSDVLAEEEGAGLLDPTTYDRFVEQARATKRNILRFLIEARNSGKRIAGYGAPGKGNTLLNFCGVGTDLIEFTVDANPGKHHRFTPGSRIPIYPPERIRIERPDLLFILPWNLREEIMQQTAYVREWGGAWVTPIPDIKVWT